MSVIEGEEALLGALSGGRVRHKVNTTRDLRSKAGRVARGSPEVMVKITGFGKGAGHIKAHLSYITRNTKLELETDRGDVVRDKAALKDLFDQWTDDIGNTPQRKNQRDTMHLVLSMPEGTPETAVRNAARRYAKRVFGANHEYVFALHTDEPHPHVHLTVKMFGFDGKRLNPRKADLQAWREAFAREMRDQGIDAEATSRSVRGVVRKAERSVVRHIERGGDQRPPRVLRVKAAQIKEVGEELIAEQNGRPAAEKPWEGRIEQRQRSIRSAWLSAAKVLENNAIPYEEQPNARPEYDRLDTARLRAGQRAAALYQSNLERDGFRAPALALSRMRDMSRLDVVQHQRPAQVLLHTHAPDGVGRHGIPDHDLRRPRTRTLAITAGAGGSSGQVSGRGAADQSLAAVIQRFVQSMPSIDTARHELRRRLASRFGATQDRDQVRASESVASKPLDRNPKER